MEKEPPFLSRETVKLLDRLTIQKLGIPGIILMENAGIGASEVVAAKIKSTAWKEPVLVLAGMGNNGGDGFVIARHLHNQGFDCVVVLLGKSSRLREGSSAETNLQALRSTGVPFHEAEDSQKLSSLISSTGCVIDAIFGTGLDRPLGGYFSQLFDTVEKAGCPVLAVDVPSGLDAETGEILGTALPAQITTTFEAAKPGLTRGKGRKTAGEVIVVPISIPRHLMLRASQDESAFRQWAEAQLGEERK